MKKIIQHPVTLVALAFVLLITAWSVIVTAAVKHRAQSVPVTGESAEAER